MIEKVERIDNEKQLEEMLSRPTEALKTMFSKLDGDVLFLGAGGKIGLSIATMAKRAIEEAGVDKRVIAVSRFSSEDTGNKFRNEGIEIIRGDLLDADFLRGLPRIKNVIYLAGMKFGSEGNLPMTWAINSYLPALVADHFRESRIIAYSTGCVYPLVKAAGGGSLETDTPEPVGEYAQSCLGRERMFEYGSLKYGTPVVLIRLNYAVEMRYGVMVDIALKVKNGQPVDLTMGYFNVIWQGEANDMILRALSYCASPARILNITGLETLSVREVATAFGRYFKKDPIFIGKEADTALLSNAGESFRLLGSPSVNSGTMMAWIADWLERGGNLLHKPTHFEVRDGKY